MRASALIATILAATLVAAGCGGDDDGGGEELSDEEFVAEVNQVCTDVAADLQAAAVGLLGATSEEEAAEAFGDEIVPVIETLISDLEEITPPADKAEDYDRLLELTTESKDLIAEDPQAAFEAESGEGDSEIAQQIEDISTEADELSASLGIPEDCGEGSGATSASGTTGSTGDTLGTDTGE